MPITTLTAGITGLLLLVLSLRVVQARREASGSEDGPTIQQRRIRGQGNLAEYAPATLILLGLLEYQGFNNWFLWVMAALFIVGRLLHGYGFGFTPHNVPGRYWGTALTWIALGLLSVAALIAGIGAIL